MDMLQDLIALGKNCNILYVEDDKRLQIETEKVLNRIFGKVLVADNGKEGLDIFISQPIDLVLTDIEMPIMNGLTMSEQIKAHNADCPIVVLSAYSSSDYFIEAIENSVDHYVLKPVNTQKLLETLYKVCQRLEDKRMAHEYKDQQIKQQIDQEKQKMLSEISNCSPNPMLVYSEGSLMFSNQAFETFFEHEALNERIKTEKDLEKYFNDNFSRDEVLKQQQEIMKPFVIEDLNQTNRKLALKTNVGKKIFLVLKSPFTLKDKERTALYTMNDITELLYQQMQLDLFDKKLNQTIEDNFVTKQPKNSGIINKVEF